MSTTAEERKKTSDGEMIMKSQKKAAEEQEAVGTEEQGRGKRSRHVEIRGHSRSCPESTWNRLKAKGATTKRSSEVVREAEHHEGRRRC